MPSLAGRPPYATDEPDSSYQSKASPRRGAPQQRPTARPRSSTYDVYDNYLGNDNSRNSGVGAAFMNGEMDDSDSEDEDRSRNYHGRKPMDPHHTPINMTMPKPAAAPPPSKNAALAAATAAAGSRKGPSPPPAYAMPPAQPQPAAIAAPRPGYAAPISALNNAARSNVGPGSARDPPPGGINIPPASPASPSSTSPHPLQPPLSPIQPAFARPRPPKADVKFSDNIMRGEKEETMVPQRGEKGDDFWRRFSMVVKEEGRTREKTSGWLRKTQGSNNGFARWIWIIGSILIIAAAGGIGLGWYMSHKAPDHYQPTAIGGSANEAGASSAATTVGQAGATAKSSLHVTPTNTVARREDELVQVTQSVSDRIQELTPTVVPRGVARLKRLHARAQQHHK